MYRSNIGRRLRAIKMSKEVKLILSAYIGLPYTIIASRASL